MLPIFCGVATSFILFPLLRKRNTRTATLKFTISNFPFTTTTTTLYFPLLEYYFHIIEYKNN